MVKGGLGLLQLPRQRDPRLDTMQFVALGPCPLESLRMGDAAPCGHPVDLPRADGLLGCDAVAMHDLPIEQIGDGRESDVWMRPHVDAARDAGRKQGGSHVIEENERPHHASLCGWQDAADLESAEITAALLDDEFDHRHRRNLRIRIVRGFNGRCNVPSSLATVVSGGRGVTDSRRWPRSHPRSIAAPNRAIARPSRGCRSWFCRARAAARARWD